MLRQCSGQDYTVAKLVTETITERVAKTVAELVTETVVKVF